MTKQVAAVLLVAVAITYYMGYEPWELVPALESFVIKTSRDRAVTF